MKEDLGQERAKVFQGKIGTISLDLLGKMTFSSLSLLFQSSLRQKFKDQFYASYAESIQLQNL